MASKKFSSGWESKASCARVETISSSSPASTARISARSAGPRCAPLEHTASLRSRAARAWRKSSITSGLSVSTGCGPQIVFTEHHCTGGSRRTERAHHLMVQFQQHRGRVRGGDFEVLGGGEVAIYTGGQFLVEH